ncbi:MAG TPA: tRNA-uridine aminocarboxypropyltransferase, partial [Planctomycetota bacterium]|nr:tRNA-uridine aminocarboxypropyltransferase [Planctomycetota bacterium]
MRPASMCLCHDLPVVDTRTGIVILQHPRERLHPFGTARLVDLILPHARIQVAHGDLAGNLHCPIEVPADAAVLYPHPRAIDIAAIAAAERPSTLIVLDGTWAHARRLYTDNPWLQSLRHVRLHPRDPSRYRIRREPQRDFLSTLEAIVGALQMLEPDTRGLDGLIAAFDRMIDRQIQHVDALGRSGRTKLPRRRPQRRLSPLLSAGNLLVVYGESSLPGGDPAATRELLQWTAARIDTGEVFEAVLRPAGAGPSARHLGHMGLSADLVRDGSSPEAARARFAAFAGPEPVLAAWTATTLAWGQCVVPSASEQLVLKIAYCNLRNHRAGFLEQVLGNEQLGPVPVACHGRARERLGNALAVARWLRAIRSESRETMVPAR